MSDERDALRARAYLLGATAEADGQSLEVEYFESATALESVEAAEEALIEEYLSGRLTPDDRRRFEEYYLASPVHRRRVEMIRRLSAGKSPVVTRRPSRTYVPLLAAAAVLVLIAGAATWFSLRAPRDEAAQTTQAVPPPPSATVPARRVLDWALSPIALRSASESPALVVPAGTDVVRLRLDADGAVPPLTRGRVVIRTVAGRDVWEGPIVPDPPSAPAIAAADVPAERLVPDDYTVTLLAVDASGVESERQRYFLRVRRAS
jgi:hypothetical protein